MRNETQFSCVQFLLLLGISETATKLYRRHHTKSFLRLFLTEQLVQAPVNPPPPQIGGRIRPISPIWSANLLGFCGFADLFCGFVGVL